MKEITVDEQTLRLVFREEISAVIQDLGLTITDKPTLERLLREEIRAALQEFDFSGLIDIHQ